MIIMERQDRSRTGFRMPAMAGPSTRTGRRPESVEARNRGVRGADGSAPYREKEASPPLK